MANNKIVDRETLKTIREKFQEKIENGNIVASKALTAQQIENVSPESGSTQTTPFRFEATGTDNNTTETPTAPIAKHLELRGNTACWNQLVQNGNFASASNWSTTRCSLSVSNNIATITANESVTSMVLRQTTLATYLGHTYLAKFNIDTTNLSNLSELLVVRYSSSTSPVQHFNIINSNVGYIIFTATTETAPQFGFYFSSSGGSTYLTGSAEISGVQLFDLSLIYGITSTEDAKANLLYFNRDYPLPYYEYNAGTLLSCQSNKLTTIGYNAFDGELEQGGIDVGGQSEVNANAVRSKNFIKVIAWQTYTLEETTAETVTPYIAEYDGNKNFIKTTAYTTDIELTNDTHFVKFYFVSSSALVPADIESVVFSITWDNSRMGYEEYSKHEYTLPNVELKSAVAIYDQITPDGTKITRVGSYTFTSEDVTSLISAWYASEHFYVSISRLSLPIKFETNAYNTSNFIFADYLSTYRQNNSASLDKRCAAFIDENQAPILRIKNISLDPSSSSQSDIDAAIVAFKEYLVGKTLYYELATPTEAQTTSFTENIEVDDFGTLEFESAATESATNPIIPQGNKFFFPADYVLLLDDLNGYVDGDVKNLAKQEDTNFKEVEDLSIVDTITSTELVTSAFYKNTIALTGSINGAKSVQVAMSNNIIYPAVISSTELTIFCGEDFETSALTVSHIYYKN